MRARVVLLLIASCGGSPQPSPTASSGPPASLVATSAAQDDVQVATVNGRPVWGSCVAAQAARGAARDVAMRECVDFELMAQEAEHRGLAVDPEVISATHTALVSQLVAYDYEAKYDKPSDFGAIYDQLLARNKVRVSHDEYRASTYARINVAKDATHDQDQAAHAIMQELADKLANERGLMSPHLDQLAKAIVGTRAKVEVKTVPPYLPPGLEKAYADALFGIPDVGRTAGPVRTSYGWDVVLWSDVVPAAHPSPAELAAQVLPDVKRSYFPQWVNSVARRLGSKIKVYEQNLPLLETL